MEQCNELPFHEYSKQLRERDICIHNRFFLRMEKFQGLTLVHAAVLTWLGRVLVYFHFRKWTWALWEPIPVRLCLKSWILWSLFVGARSIQKTRISASSNSPTFQHASPGALAFPTEKSRNSELIRCVLSFHFQCYLPPSLHIHQRSILLLSFLEKLANSNSVSSTFPKLAHPSPPSHCKYLNASHLSSRLPLLLCRLFCTYEPLIPADLPAWDARHARLRYFDIITTAE